MTNAKKYFVLDSSVLLTDADAIYKFDDGNIIIPMAVLEELDSKKNLQNEVGRNARQVNRYLDDLRKEKGSLTDGIDLYPGSLKILTMDDKIIDHLPMEYRDFSKKDNIIIAVALSVKNNIDGECVLISKDINMRIKADVLGVKCEEYETDKMVDDISSLYSGCTTLETEHDKINEMYALGGISFTDEEAKMANIFPNEFVILKSDRDPSKTAMGRWHKAYQAIRMIPMQKDIFGIKGKNKEQNFALDLLFDDSVKLVSLIGLAGCGKTILAIAAGVQQVLHEKKYSKMVITKPIQSVGKDIGFLPGTKQEKLEPWIAPIKDNLSFLYGNKKVKARGKNEKDWTFYDDLFLNGTIEVEAITYMRGRSLPNSFMIIDEAQNCSIHELKTIITRVGEGTKIILTGDLDQVDSPYLDSYSNGLTCVIEKFKQYDLAGHITMIKGERSSLATLASQIL